MGCHQSDSGALSLQWYVGRSACVTGVSREESECSISRSHRKLKPRLFATAVGKETSPQLLMNITWIRWMKLTISPDEWPMPLLNVTAKFYSTNTHVLCTHLWKLFPCFWLLLYKSIYKFKHIGFITKLHSKILRILWKYTKE